MANETELANISHQTDVLSDGISAALVQKIVALGLVYLEPYARGITNVKLFQKDGSLTAEAVSESSSYSFSSSSELTMTEITSTATKYAVATKLTLEAQEFSRMNVATIAMKQGEALRRDLDDDILALTSSFSNQVTSTTTLTVADILDAIYQVRSNTAGVSELPLVSVFDYKGVNEILKEINASAASIYTHERHVSLLAGMTASNGFRGTLPGLDVYETNGLPTSGGDDVGLVFDPAIAIAGQFGPIQTRVEFEGSAGGWDEVYSYCFADFVEWNDQAGCGVLSDT